MNIKAEKIEQVIQIVNRNLLLITSNQQKGKIFEVAPLKTIEI